MTWRKKFRWAIASHPVTSVKTANGEHMIVYGVAKVTLSVGGRNIESEILITPDLNGLIVGIDWLAKQSEFVWDFRNQQIKFADGKWMNLHEEDQDEANIRRIWITFRRLVQNDMSTAVLCGNGNQM